MTILSRSVSRAADLIRQHEVSVSPGPQYAAQSLLPLSQPSEYPVKFLAFYLPQFHAIEQNDHWWGKGFTEWTNVTKALPRYKGQLQPRLPSDLGFYDLSNPEAIMRQAEMVRRSGVYGVCIHDYWFSGTKVLQTPLNLILGNKDIDLRFCVNWANESWSRRWDGSENEILIEQVYDPADPAAYVRSLLAALQDPRYIKVGDRPLIMVYRPSVIPRAREMFAAWREFLSAEGVADPFLVMAQSFDDFDPRPYGLDAAAGFPPHNAGIWDESDLKPNEIFDPYFTGRARSYRELARRVLQNRPQDYRLFPGVCPSWDNEARKPRRGFSLRDASPAVFERWLLDAGQRALAAPASERFVFINAWNEWAEGAVLEPDRHFGYGNMLAVRRSLERLSAVHESSGGGLGDSVPVPAASGSSIRRTARALKRRIRRLPF